MAYNNKWLFAALALCLFTVSIAFDPRVEFPGDTPAERAKALLAKMTTDEKLSMVHGYGTDPYVGNVMAIPRLNIPRLNLEDGPQGIADGQTKITCFPSALTVVSTWDTGLMYRFARGMGEEQRGKGTNIALGPMVNIARVPMGGRNFESFGEDPFLASQMVFESIKGFQSTGVMATVKHFVDNNQELNRTLVSENVPQRAQWEIYYPAFDAAVRAGVGAVMCSYNRINDTYACENDRTLNTDLKGIMGYQGFVMSDWGATHSTVKAANSGLDMQMPDDSYFGKALAEAVAKGQVPMARLNDMVLRILTSMFAVGIFDIPQPTGNLSDNVQSTEHTALALELATAANVLLQNDNNILPIDIDSGRIRTIAVLGDDGYSNPTATGWGSGHVNPPYIIAPLDGIKQYLQSKGRTDIKVVYAPTSPIENAAKLAKSADIAIVFVANTSGEGVDRTSLSMGSGQDTLVASVGAVQPNTVVVAHVPGSVLMPWSGKVKGIISAFLPGQMDGQAIAAVLFGDHNPSARLPVTFPVKQSQIPVNTVQQYPGINNEANYSEDLLVGYRWYDAKGISPLFPFGHGLSYTSFQYSNLRITGTAEFGVGISATVENVGHRDGSEVVQLYIGYPPSLGEPPRVLKGFQKIKLEVGEKKTVNFRLSPGGDLATWDVSTYGWRLPQGDGTWTAYVGASSRDIRLQGTFKGGV